MLRASYSKAIERDIGDRPTGIPTLSLGWLSLFPELLRIILSHFDFFTPRQLQADNLVQPHDAFNCSSRLAREYPYTEQGFLAHFENRKQPNHTLRLMLGRSIGKPSRDATSMAWIRRHPGVFRHTALRCQSSTDIEEPGPFPDESAHLFLLLWIVWHPQDESASRKALGVSLIRVILRRRIYLSTQYYKRPKRHSRNVTVSSLLSNPH